MLFCVYTFVLHGDAVPAQVSMVERESTLRFLCFSFVEKRRVPAVLRLYDVMAILLLTHLRLVIVLQDITLTKLAMLDIKNMTRQKHCMSTVRHERT